MKNLKIIATTMTSFAFVLMSLSPAVADAKGLSLGSVLSSDVSVSASHDKDKHDDEDKDDVRVRTSANATVTASSGIMLPPGLEKRLEDGKGLPKGMEKRLDDGKGYPKGLVNWFEHWFKKNGSSTVDMILPVIKDVKTVSVGTSTATISWKTNGSTTGEVRFATSSTVGASSSLALDSSASTSHSVALVGLSVDTQYYFTITAKDSAGNTKVTNVMRFHTTAVASADVTAPSIYFSTTFSTTASSTHIFWLTNERSDSRVWVGTSTPVTVTGSSTISLSDKVFLHDVTVSGLTASTTYFYAVESADASGNISAAATGSFTTSH